MKKIVAIISAVSILLLAGCSTQSGDTNTTTAQQDVNVDEKLEILSEAYTYLYPLVIMDATLTMQTNSEEASPAGAPINQFTHTQELRNADTKSVVTPNVDTLYSTAWLDISKEPIIYTTPETDRFMQTQVLDAWSNTPEVISEGGAYMIATSDQDVETPEGVTRVDVPTSMVWFICRPVLDGDDDLSNVVKLQEQMSLIPLSEYDNAEEYNPPKGEFKEENVYVPVDKVNSMSANTFFNLANELLVNNPPATEDEEIVSKIKELNIGAGLTFDSTSIIEDEKEFENTWEDIKEECYTSWAKSSEEFSIEAGNWTYLGEPIGNFGTEYEYRAATALKGLGANPVQVAMYLQAKVDNNGESLSGKNTYVIHFDETPPVLEKGFWSVTMYGDDNFLVDNPIDRYVINDRSDIEYNEDGSLDIVVSAQAPEDDSNWLPAPEEEFHLWLRIYSPDVDGIYDGWKTPTIEVQ